MFYNITSSLYTSLNYQQIVLCICSILVNLRDSLYYMRPSCHACNGLHRCSHNWYTITSCNTSRRSQKDAITHWGSTTFNHALTGFIWGIHFQFLKIPKHPHFDWDKQFLLYIDVPIQDHEQQLEIYEVFHLVTPHGNFLSMLQHRQQVFRHNLWWNQSSRDFRTTVQHMSKG